MEDYPRSHLVIAWAIATVSIAFVIVVLRMFCRIRVVRFFGREDWCIIVSLLFSIGNTVGMCIQASNGLGRHISTINSSQMIIFLKAFYFTIFFYQMSLTFTKISILFLYLRIFEVSRIRYACYFALAVVALYGIEMLFTSLLRCVPAAHWWDSAHVAGSCMNLKPLYYFNVAFNIVTDFTILLLPMPVIHTLALPPKQKVALYFIFALGFFVSIMSSLRLHWLIVAANSRDSTWDNVGIAAWSCIELNVGIICPCLTTMKPLLSHCFPRYFPSRNPVTKPYHKYGDGIDSLSNKTSSKTSHGTDKQPSILQETVIEFEDESTSHTNLHNLEPVAKRPFRDTLEA